MNDGHVDVVDVVSLWPLLRLLGFLGPGRTRVGAFHFDRATRKECSDPEIKKPSVVAPNQMKAAKSRRLKKPLGLQTMVTWLFFTHWQQCCRSTGKSIIMLKNFGRFRD